MPGTIKQQNKRLTKKIEMTRSTLQGQQLHKKLFLVNIKKQLHKKQQNKKSNNSKGNSQAYFFASSKGSMTLEAAISMAAFLWIIFMVMNLFQIIAEVNKIHATYDEVVRETVKNQYTIYRTKQFLQKEDKKEKSESSPVKEEVENRITGIYLQMQLQNELGKDFFELPEIKYGSGAIRVMVEKELPNQIETTIRYQVKLRGTVGEKLSIPMARKSAVCLWKGKSLKENQDSQKVYMTEEGTVFHNSLQCSSLKLSIKSIEKSAISFQRNEKGGKYYPCRFCLKGDTAQYYITEDGDRYHGTLSCSRLKRTIRTLLRSQVKGIPECKKCGNIES